MHTERMEVTFNPRLSFVDVLVSAHALDDARDTMHNLLNTRSRIVRVVLLGGEKAILGVQAYAALCIDVNEDRVLRCVAGHDSATSLRAASSQASWFFLARSAIRQRASLRMSRSPLFIRTLARWSEMLMKTFTDAAGSLRVAMGLKLFPHTVEELLTKD